MDQEMIFKNLISKNAIHQPVVICIDTSDSMGMDAGNGQTKLQMVEDLVNSLKNVDLSETEKNVVDICILGFGSSVYTIEDWTNLSMFQGNVKLETTGQTAMNSVILEAIKKTREIRRVYYNGAVRCRRAAIFVYSDGFSTEPMEEVYEKSQSYFNRDIPKPSAKLNMLFIPTFYDGKIIKMTDDDAIDEYKALVKGLGKKVAFINAEDCINGIPASFKFMMDSIVEWSVSAPGETVSVNMDSGLVAVQNHGGIQRQDGSNVVIDTDLDDEIEIM